MYEYPPSTCMPLAAHQMMIMAAEIERLYREAPTLLIGRRILEEYRLK